MASLRLMSSGCIHSPCTPVPSIIPFGTFHIYSTLELLAHECSSSLSDISMCGQTLDHLIFTPYSLLCTIHGHLSIFASTWGYFCKSETAHSQTQFVNLYSHWYYIFISTSLCLNECHEKYRNFNFWAPLMICQQPILLPISFLSSVLLFLSYNSYS